MEITGSTKLKDLLAAHPRMLGFLTRYRPEYARLGHPALRATLGAVATLEAVAVIGRVPLDDLLADIGAEIAAIEASDDRDATGGGHVVGGTEDSAQREELKRIVRDLHSGVPPERLKRRFAELSADLSAGRLAAIEQELIDEGLPVEEVRRLCDVHVEVFRDALEAQELPELPPGHPITTMLAENARALHLTAELRALLAGPGDEVPAGETVRVLADLAEIDRHYMRKEHQLFPFLEAKHFTGPSSVMWSLHDEIRGLLSAARRAAEAGEPGELREASSRMAGMIEEMVYKEEHILLPACLAMLDAEEWEQVRAGEPAIGYAWIPEPPPWPEEGGAASGVPARSPAGEVVLTTGALDASTIGLMLSTLPLDISFVDEDDRVRFYSEGHRVFPRSPAVIGRRVQACHPPASVDRVQRILDSFRSGEQDVAEFWFELKDRFIHIRYFAMRDEAGYRGCLEVVQDVTDVRSLEDERRLLDW